MSTDRLLGVISIVLGLPSVVGLFVIPEHRIQGVLVTLIAAIIIAWGFWWKWEQDRPQFTSLELRKTYRISRADGSHATVQRFEKMKANFKGISEWWNRGLMHDGEISNILIDSEKPHLEEVNAGATDVCKRFLRPLEIGEEQSITLTYDLTNSFVKPHESVIHNSSTKINEVVITVELPRPCIKAEVRMTYSGIMAKSLPLLN